MFTLRLLWLWISIMCLCGVTCLSSDCCGSESEYCVCVEWHVYPQTAVALNQYNVSVWSDMFTLRLLWLWIRILCLCGVICLPSDCCGSESEYCVCVEWHVYPQTAVALNQNIVSVWSDMFTFRLLWLWIGIMCLWSDMFTLGLLWLWIRIMCLCGVTCLPSDCCDSESG
jgi:hypothetical protein